MPNKIVINANEFLEAANRCDFQESIKNKKYPLLVPEFVNTAFACELYMKAIAKFQGIEEMKKHKLDELFKMLSLEAKEAIYDLWRVSNGNYISACDYARQMFSNNLEAITNVFVRFRYAHEWSESTISLEHSFTVEQFIKFSPMSASRPLGSPPVYSGFLKQFALSLKIYAEKLIGRQYNS